MQIISKLGITIINIVIDTKGIKQIPTNNIYNYYCLFVIYLYPSFYAIYHTNELIH